MSSSVPDPASPSSRRSFVVRAAAAIVAGLSGGHLLRSVATSAARVKERVTVRPHAQAVPRTNARPSSHE